MQRMPLSIFIWIVTLGLAMTLLGQEQAPLPAGKRILVKTTQGDFTLLLYDDTPLHQAAFVHWVETGAYEGVIFHRVINQFMVQSGNLCTRGAKPETDVNIDTLTQTIPAEILTDRHIHKRGALAAARIVDEALNPNKVSSGSQFFLVTGTYYTDFDLQDVERRRTWQYTPEQRNLYKFHGGDAWLDGDYTVFGEVIEGYDVLTKIEDLPTDNNNRPKKDVIILQMRLLP